MDKRPRWDEDARGPKEFGPPDHEPPAGPIPPGPPDERGMTKADFPILDQEANLRAALREIRNTQGKVCRQYEICEHVACQSSYASWAIADAALSENRRPDEEASESPPTRRKAEPLHLEGCRCAECVGDASESGQPPDGGS